MAKAVLTQKGSRADLLAQRRRAMLDAAAEAFLEKGYAHTSLNDIIERSKGSLSTLYGQFGNKEGLLRAMIVETCVWPGAEATLEQDLSMEERLFELGMQFATTALTPKMIAVYRIITAEALRIPDLVKFFFETGPKRVRKRVQAQLRVSLPSNDTGLSYDDLARLFIGSIIGDLHFMYSLGMAPISHKQIEKHVEAAVHLFIRGLQWHRGKHGKA